MNKHKRAKVPTVLQMEAVECGAASLAMILAYHGKYLPLEKLRIDCGISRDGSKASNILKAAREYGFEAKGYRKDPESLKEMAPPLIIHWEFSHFLVLEGYTNGKFHLNDPSSGRRAITEEEMDKSFTGIALSFSPSPEFTKNGRKPGITSALRKRLRGSEIPLTYIILIGLAMVIPGLIVPVFSRVFVDDILLGEREQWIVPLLLGMSMTALLRGVLTWIQQYYLLKLETKIAITTSSQFLWHVLSLPTEFFSQRYAGDIAGRIQSNDTVAKLLSGQLATTALNLVTIVFYFILMLLYNPFLALIGLLFAVINGLYLRYVSAKRKEQNSRLLKDRGSMLGTGMSGLQLIETLKATGSESDFFANWSGYQAKALNSEQELGVSSQMLSVLPVFLTGLNSTIVLAFGGFLIMKGQMTIGMLVAFQSLMASFMAPVNKMVELGSKLQEVDGEMRRLDDVLKYPMDQEPAQSNREDPAYTGEKLKGYVALNQVTFGYNRLEPPLIQDFSLALKPGERVALVGGSGSGKSTMIRLITGIHRHWSGQVLLDDMPAQHYSKEVVCNSLAMVDQDIKIFQGSLRDNITLWDDTITEAQMIRAAKDACIHEDITARSGGYDHIVEEGGRNFSGGQRQRIEIARALAQNPSIIIMDEATSALDPITEKKVDENIRRRGCTCIIVAHRLSTIRDCDEIIVLNRGKIIERGTHEDLKNLDGNYAALIRTS